MKTKIIKSDWHAYPRPVHVRTGHKVSWHYYKSLGEAEQCANAAKHNALIQLRAGYDFGYCSPGVIYGPDKQSFYPGLYEVCLP